MKKRHNGVRRPRRLTGGAYCGSRSFRTKQNAAKAQLCPSGCPAARGSPAETAGRRIFISNGRRRPNLIAPALCHFLFSSFLRIRNLRRVASPPRICRSAFVAIPTALRALSHTVWGLFRAQSGGYILMLLTVLISRSQTFAALSLTVASYSTMYSASSSQRSFLCRGYRSLVVANVPHLTCVWYIYT